MTNAEYHASEGISKSDLDLLHRSPAHYKYRKANPREQTPAMLLGSVTHKMLLEPADFSREFAVMPECDRRTKEGKAVWKAFTDELEANTIVISRDVFETAAAMTNAVKSHAFASRLLRGGRSEQSFFWDENGIPCKCRPDYLRDDGIVIDVKSTLNASPEEFPRSAYNFRYHVQAWWYLHGLQRLCVPAREFVFIAVEKEPPFAVCVYVADDTVLKLGEQEAQKDLETYRWCMEHDNWYGYERIPETHSLMLPEWAARKAESIC